VELKLPFVSPQQVLRALDDLHALAEAARALPEVEHRLTERIDALETRAGQVLALGERIDGQATRLIETAEQAEGRVGDLLAHADRLDSRIDKAEPRVGEVLESAQALTHQAARLADALPTLEQALSVVDELAPTAAALALTVEPLQGAAERLGRIVDRFPGGPGRRGTHGE